MRADCRGDHRRPEGRGCRGVNLSTLGWEDKLPAILAAAGLEFGV